MEFAQYEGVVLPRMTQKNLESGRIYTVDEGEHAGKSYPSITRVLGAAPKPHLEAWKERVGAEEAGLIKQRAANRGERLHKLSELYLANKALPSVSLSVVELWRNLHTWLDEHVTCVYLQEANIYSDLLGVAGRFDLLADVDGVLSIVDFKQSDKPKRESWITDYYLQGTFYSLALYERTGLRAKRIIFPITSPQGTAVFETSPLTHYKKLISRIEDFYATVA
jgi:hypothetical protein